MRRYHTLRPRLYAQMIQARMAAATGDAFGRDLETEAEHISAETGMTPLMVACDLMGGRSRMRCQGPATGTAANTYRYCREQCPIKLRKPASDSPLGSPSAGKH